MCIRDSAKRYRVSVAELKSWNRISGDTVGKGTILKVHVPYGRAASRQEGRVIRAAEVRPLRNAKASRVKVVMDARKDRTARKGLVKSGNSRSAKATPSRKQAASSVKKQVSARKTPAPRKAAKNRKKA